ncbi:hypothetical protein FNV43_RR19184 [Rhamnella rubrinervis]|uniref:Uncharacterized protein n=1 Tax=Rhamnella rubrinervis TaxID=2594499 RepID=A0A8K0E6K0_9ROSA|nr:hypothetical protein FNV43_RR19184 [Rhamnella rubrinervis]
MDGGRDIEETHSSNGGDADHADEDEWSFEENKRFENEIAEWMSRDYGCSEEVMMIQQIASKIPGKTVAQITHHLKALSEDIEMIEKGVIPIPNYVDHINTKTKTKPTTNTLPRRRGIPWTKQEHELFLEGLVKYGKGDWRSISRLCVVTRTPTQVASHAQKHFLRCENTNKKINKMAIKYSSSPSPAAAHHQHHHNVSQGQGGVAGNAILITAPSSSSPPPCPSCQRPFSS